MPIFDVHTNLPAERIPKEFSIKVIRLICDVAELTPDRVQVLIHPNAHMLMNENTEPTARFSLGAIFSIMSKESRQRLGDEITKLGSELLGIPPIRFFVLFIDIDPANVMVEGKFLTEWLVLLGKVPANGSS